jgi:hypothetical protein
MRERPNVLRISRAAPLDREDFWAESNFQKATILGPRSGVGWMRLFGGFAVLYS